MYVVTITLSAIRPEDRASGTVSKEEKVGNGWKRLELLPLATGARETERRLVLNDNQRVVIEGQGSTEVVFDAKQSAAVPRRRTDDAIEREIEREHARRVAEEAIAEERRLQALHAATTRLRSRARLSEVEQTLGDD